jgi:hypothetical protein
MTRIPYQHSGNCIFKIVYATLSGLIEMRVSFALLVLILHKQSNPSKEASWLSLTWTEHHAKHTRYTATADVVGLERQCALSIRSDL